MRAEENPAFYQSLRERLEEIIAARRQERLDAARQLELLSGLREELRGEQAQAENLGLHARGFAIYGLLEQHRPMTTPEDSPTYDGANRDLPPEGACRRCGRGEAARRLAARAARRPALGRPPTCAPRSSPGSGATRPSGCPSGSRRGGRTAGRRASPARRRDQRKRWGSCDHRGTIRLNWRIVQAPMRLVDYVVVHELVHLRHRGHGRDYWQAVGRVMPDYERRREELRKCGFALAW